jgi:16S rRNA (guanine527-N7)-methyltransferase
MMAVMKTLQSGAEKLGIDLTPEHLEQYELYYREMISWNRRLNLTRIIGYEDVQTKHFLDSLTVMLALPAGPGGFRLIDVGTGAGLPGIPLKIAIPGISLVLLESTAKKTDFLRHMVGMLGLDDVEVVAGRAEETAHDSRYREKFDVALSRAVAALPALTELTLPYCSLGGTFIAQKKGEMEEELCQADKAITLLGGRLREVKKIDLGELPDRRSLVVIDKVALTPQNYPRRSGVPEKKPLV